MKQVLAVACLVLVALLAVLYLSLPASSETPLVEALKALRETSPGSTVWLAREIQEPVPEIPGLTVKRSLEPKYGLPTVPTPAPPRLSLPKRTSCTPDPTLKDYIVERHRILESAQFSVSPVAVMVTFSKPVGEEALSGLERQGVRILAIYYATDTDLQGNRGCKNPGDCSLQKLRQELARDFPGVQLLGVSGVQLSGEHSQFKSLIHYPGIALVDVADLATFPNGVYRWNQRPPVTERGCFY